MKVRIFSGLVHVYDMKDIEVACFKSMYSCLNYLEVINAMEKGRQTKNKTQRGCTG